MKWKVKPFLGPRCYIKNISSWFYTFSYDIVGYTVHPLTSSNETVLKLHLFCVKEVIWLEIFECPLQFVPGNVCRRVTIIFQTIYIYHFTISDFGLSEEKVNIDIGTHWYRNSNKENEQTNVFIHLTLQL